MNSLSRTVVFVISLIVKCSSENSKLPLVINTWGFSKATQVAWNTLRNDNGTALDAVENGCSEAEEDFSIDSVGWGAHPDETGETTLDALIFDGPTHKAGAVGDLRRIKSAISVARKVLENTGQTLLVGDQATQFAVQMGFNETSLSSNSSKQAYEQWKKDHCQPNYWINVTPDPKTSCGPYKPNKFSSLSTVKEKLVDYSNHDTIGMVVIDGNGRLAAGTSTNGLKYKISGRVGDSPIPGSGAYVDQAIGGAAATGDGDIMMRLVPAYQAVENLRNGFSAIDAARDAIKRIYDKYPKAQGAIIVASITGDYGAACFGLPEFPFSIVNPINGEVRVKKISCLS